MLHTETVSTGTLDLLREIQAMPSMVNMRLVGGTALALHIGHRKSIDLDLFGRFDEKDFIDMAFLLRKFNLVDLLELYRQKFSVSEYSFALRGLTYFDDAEDDPMPEMLVPATWKDVKHEIELKVREFTMAL